MMKRSVNRFFAIAFGLWFVGVGGILGVMAIFSRTGYAEEPLPLVALVLVFAMSIGMQFVGLITLTSYAYETTFDKNGIEMQFAFRRERVLRGAIQWHRKLFFRNAISEGANVWVLLRYAIPGSVGPRFRRAVVVVFVKDPPVGMTTKYFQTPFDSWMAVQ